MSHLSPVSLQRRWRGPSAVPVEHPEPLTLHLYNCQPLSCAGTQQVTNSFQEWHQTTTLHTETSYILPYTRGTTLSLLSPHKAQQLGLLVEWPGLGIPHGLQTQSQSTGSTSAHTGFEGEIVYLSEAHTQASGIRQTLSL